MAYERLEAEIKKLKFVDSKPTTAGNFQRSFVLGREHVIFALEQFGLTEKNITDIQLILDSNSTGFEALVSYWNLPHVTNRFTKGQPWWALAIPASMVPLPSYLTKTSLPEPDLPVQITVTLLQMTVHTSGKVNLRLRISKG